MTRSEAKFLLDHPDIAREFAENGTQNLEYQDTQDPFWVPSGSPNFECEFLEYRIRPQPKLRPWTPDEVPDCWVRKKGCPSRWLVLAVFEDGVTVSGDIGISLAHLAEAYEYRSADGKWLPCGNYDVR